MKKFTKGLLFGAAIGAIAAGAYYVMKKNDADKFDEDDFEDDLDAMYETTCPACNNTFHFDYEQAAPGSMDCPNCGARLEFQLDDDGDAE